MMGVDLGAESHADPVDEELAKTGVPSVGMGSDIGAVSPPPEQSAPPVGDFSAIAPPTGYIGSHEQLAQSGQVWTNDDYANVEAHVLRTVPSLRNDRARTTEVVNQFMGVADMDLMDVMYADTEAALALSTDDYLQAYVEAYFERGGPSVSTAAILSAVQQYEERFGTIQDAASLLADQDAIGREFEAGAVKYSDAYFAAGGADAVVPASSQDFAHAVEDGSARGGVWKTEGVDLAFAWSDDSGTFTSQIVLEPGTVVESTADAIAAYALAQAGIRHTLVDGGAPGEKNLAGGLASALGNTVRWAENNTAGVTLFAKDALDSAISGRALVPAAFPTPAEQASAVEKSDEERAQAQAEQVTDKASALAVIGDYLELNGFVGDGRELILAAGEGFDAMLSENPDALAEMQASTKEELIAQFRQEDEDRGVIVPWFEETVLNDSVVMLETVDQMIHKIGLGMIAVPTAAGYVFDGDAATTIGDAFNESLRNEYVSEAFGIEADSALGVWMNLGASILFDPLTWITAGGSASWKWAEELLTNPAMARTFVRQPQVRSAVRQMVRGDDSRVVWAMLQDGMLEDDVLRLLEITGTKYTDDIVENAARQEVTDIMVRNLPSAGGAWNPAGPRALTHVKNAQGVAEAFKNIPGLSAARQEQLAGLVARAGRDRSATMGDDFLQQALDAALWRYGGNLEKAQEAFESAVTAARSTSHGSPEAIAATAQKVERLNRLARSSAVRLNQSDAATVGGYREFLDDLADEVAKASAAGDDAAVAQLESLAENARVHVATFGDDYDELIEQASSVKAQVEQATHEVKALRSPKDRAPIETWWQEFYQDWGRQIGLDEVEEAHPYLRGEKKLDWGRIVGEADAEGWNETNVRNLMGWTGDPQALSSEAQSLMAKAEKAQSVMDDAADMIDNGVGLTAKQKRAQQAIERNAKQARDKALKSLGDMDSDAKYAMQELEAVGVGARRGQTLLPASPLELLAFENSGKYFEGLMSQAAKQKVSHTLDSVQTIFASSVLLNLNTPVKTHLDEIIRFVQDVGFNRDTVFRSNGIGRGTQGGRSQAYQRVASSPVEHAMRPWKMISPSKKGQWRAAERWVNGSLLRDDVFKAYARALQEFGDGDEARRFFAQWWDEEGHQLARRTSLGGSPVDADRAYDAVRNGFDLMLSSGNIDDAARWSDELLEAAAKGEALEVGPARWRRFADVPGQEQSAGKGLTGALNKTFDVLYGMPSARRGGVIYEHYFEWKRNLLEKAWAGRIIDEDLLVRHGFADDVLGAREILARGERSPVVRSMKDTGYRLRSDIDAAAANYAKATADSMMYQMGTVSVLGKKMSRVYPWGRAQTDYLGYWAKKLTEPTTFQAQVGTKGVGPAANVNTGVNLRLLDRIGHVASLGNPDGASDPYSPGWMVEGFTFMPSVLDDSFLMENTLSAGPIASWAVNWLPADHPLRKGFEELHPSHRVFNDYQNTGMDAIGNFADALVPESPRSLRTLFGTELSAVAAQLGYDPSTFYQWMIGESEPPFYRSQLGLSIGNYLDEGDFWQDVVAGTGQGTPWGDTMNLLGEEATRNAYGREGVELLRKQVGMPAVFADEMQYAKFYLPMESYLTGWVAEGWVSEGLADNYRANAAEVGADLRGESGVQTYADRNMRRDFVDAAVDIFYALPDEERYAFQIMHPGIAVNLVAGSEVAGPVPDEWAASVSGGRIVVDGSKRIEAYRAGREEGWLVPRSTVDIQSDIANNLNRAASSYLRWVFEWSTGSTWGRQTEREGKATKFGRGVISFGAEQVAKVKPVFDELGVDVPAEWGTDAGWQMTAAEFKSVLGATKAQFQPRFEIDKTVDAALSNTDDGRALVEASSAASKFSDDAGVDSPLDWVSIQDPDGEINWITGSAQSDLEAYRAEFRGQIATNPNFTEAMYNDSYARYFGPLDYEPPVPPQESALDVKVTGAPAEFRVVDGDTIAYTAADGEDVRFRLMGINAPDDHETQQGYAEATFALRDFLNSHENVTLGSFDAERFGTTQKFKSFIDGQVVEDERIFAWLYVDGVPVWNPAEFSPDNERGMPTTVAVPEYKTWWLRESATGEVS